MLARKAFGVYPQEVMAPASPLLAGLGDAFMMPVSRHSTVAAEDILARRRLTLAACSPVSGPAIVEDRAARATAVFNHFEYEADTLEREYRRDLMRDLAVDPPAGGTPETAFWNRAGRRFYGNWLDLVRRAAGAGRVGMAGEMAA
jgi:homoserine O-succinyltransferase